ncbi:hypothetical protein MBLNU230_g5656t1 [Neophaeotheca triangularis]
MAVTDALPGVEVTVEVDGQPLKEFTDQELEEEPRTITRYVEAVSGKRFILKVEVNKHAKFHGNNYRVSVEVDGHSAQQRLINKPKKSGTPIMASIEGFLVSGTEVKEFMFSGLDLACDGKVLNKEAEVVKKLGVIGVAIEHRNITGISKFKNKTTPDPVGVLSEKALKGEAISHTVEYGGTKTTKTNGCRTKEVCGQPCPAATYLFKYRSNAALRSLLIIPRAPTPESLERREAGSLSQAEIREMQKRLVALESQMRTKPKPEVKRDIKRETKREAADENPRRRKISRPSTGSTQLELELDDDGGSFRETPPSSLGLAKRKEIIELD